MTPETLTDWATARPYVTAAAAGAFVLALLAVAWAARRQTSRKEVSRRTPAAVVVTGIAAAACTAYSAGTSWHFAKDQLDMADTGERIAFFAAGELVLFATAFLARHNTLATGAAGTPGTLVWLITGVQVVAAYSESGPVGGTVRAVVGPVFAALLWHLAMGVELRHQRPDAAGGGFVALVGRDIRERALSRLGVVERDRDAAQITRDRWTARAVEHAARLSVLDGKARAGRRGRRLEGRLSKAIARAEVGTNEAQRGQLLAALAARRHAARLATVDLPDPWAPAAVDTPEGAHLVRTPAAVPPVPPAGTAPLPAPSTAAVEPSTATPGSRPPATPVEGGARGEVAPPGAISRLREKGPSPVRTPGSDQAFSVNGEKGSAPVRGPEIPSVPRPELTDAKSASGTPEPTPGTGDRAGGTAERNQDPEPVPDDDEVTAFERHVSSVRAMLQEDPELSGTAIGTRLGTGDSYGRRVRRAALNGSA